MSENRSIDEIKEEKIEKLRESADGSAAGSPSEPVHVGSPGDLSETVDRNDVVLVDFYADWCGPCKMLEPTVEELAAETEAAVAKVDVDRNQQLAGQYGVQGVPMLLLFADGEPVEKLVGVQSKDDLAGLIDAYS
ncbi:thioredoxin [Halorientalis regularis]|jgi:thioredoxin 1|uniref:Thioredoxin n=1 Tax=Halorientalis regularis TaxID=660518 RepID=A0A1G7N6B8_9EURY|nr:thioredoxin [Halorientalis regularis]SDF69496.1 thioredoxin [Halorientalis regularis]